MSAKDEDKRLNEIIRVQKLPNNYFISHKDFLENSNLSWKAKGMLAYLLSKPDNWKVVSRDLINRATDGKSAVYSGLKELGKKGYYQKIPIRSNDSRRISHWESTISEVPMESLENTNNSLLPDFQEIDNQNIEKQYIENRERNNNYNNKIYKDLNNNQSSQSVRDRQDRDETENIMCQIEAYTELIKANIDYDSLIISRPHDVGLINEFIGIIIDTIMTQSDTVRIGKKDKPRALVQSTLLKLNYGDIEHAIEQFKGITERIYKKKQYIRSMLYNNKMELNSHYTNLVKHDMYNGGEKLDK